MAIRVERSISDEGDGQENRIAASSAKCKGNKAGWSFYQGQASKNRVSLRIVTDNPQTPPPVCEYAGEIHLTSASAERMEGVAPLSIKSNYYLIWARVDGAGHSKPVKVWVGSQPPPPAMPIITAVETAPHAIGN